MELIRNPHIIVPLLTYLIAQSLKMFLKASKGDFNWRYMFVTGDMPSVHTAVAVSLAISLAVIEGLDSPLFALSLFWASFIIYDSMNVRRAVGEQGSIIVKLIELTKSPKDQRDVLKVREVLGHTPLEVTAGALTGLVISSLLLFNYWPVEAREWVQSVSQQQRLAFYLLFGFGLLAGFVVIRYYSRSDYRKLPSARRIRRGATTYLITPALFGMLFTLMQSAGIRWFSSKAWMLVVSAWLVLGIFYLWLKIIRGSKPGLNQESVHFTEAKKRRTRRKHKRKK